MRRVLALVALMFVAGCAKSPSVILLPPVTDCRPPRLATTYLRPGEQRAFAFSCYPGFGDSLGEWVARYHAAGYTVAGSETFSSEYSFGFNGAEPDLSQPAAYIIGHCDDGIYTGFSFAKGDLWGELIAHPDPKTSRPCTIKREYVGRVQRSRVAGAPEPWRVNVPGYEPRR